MWAFGVGAALAVIAVVVTLLPFFRRRRAGEPVEAFDAEGVRVQREGVYQALETLRLERELGQVEEAEYARQAEEYRRRAALLVREQERLLAEGAPGGDDASNDALEREVAEARERLRRMEEEGP